MQQLSIFAYLSYCNRKLEKDPSSYLHVLCIFWKIYVLLYSTLWKSGRYLYLVMGLSVGRTICITLPYLQLLYITDWWRETKAAILKNPLLYCWCQAMVAISTEPYCRINAPRIRVLVVGWDSMNVKGKCINFNIYHEMNSNGIGRHQFVSKVLTVLVH